MPEPYILPPNWKTTFDYHECSWRDCDQQAPFAMFLGVDKKLAFLCPDHNREVETERERLLEFPADLPEEQTHRLRQWVESNMKNV